MFCQSIQKTKIPNSELKHWYFLKIPVLVFQSQLFTNAWVFIFSLAFVIARTYLVLFVLEDADLEKLGILKTNATKGQVTSEYFEICIAKFVLRLVTSVSGFIHDLRHPDDLAVGIADRHAD